MRKHTEGPWEVGENTEGTIDVLAEVWGEEKGWHEIALDIDTPENAKLIAASPRMLQALRSIVGSADDAGCTYDVTVVDADAVEYARTILSDLDAL